MNVPWGARVPFLSLATKRQGSSVEQTDPRASMVISGTAGSTITLTLSETPETWLRAEAEITYSPAMLSEESEANVKTFDLTEKQIDRQTKTTHVDRCKHLDNGDNGANYVLNIMFNQFFNVKVINQCLNPHPGKNAQWCLYRLECDNIQSVTQPTYW